MSKRFVSVYLDMMKEVIFDDSEMFKTYVWILSQTRYKDGYVILNKVKVNLKRGEALIESRKWAAEVLNLSENRYRKILKDLEELGYVKIESTNRYTIIKPLKWALYEQLDDNNNQPTTNRAPTDHRQTTNSYININNNKRDIKEIYNNTSIPTSRPTGFSNFTPSASSSVDPEWEKENLKKQLSKFKYN